MKLRRTVSREWLQAEKEEKAFQKIAKGGSVVRDNANGGRMYFQTRKGQLIPLGEEPVKVETGS